jgi:non-canonical (house-cleaning) NTP pyrophosphatase
VVAADARVYDTHANVCAIDLVVAVAPSDRVVIENELPGGSDRTVDGDGKRALTTVVPAASDVLIYAVNLEAGISNRLQKYRVTEDCGLRQSSSTDSDHNP